MMMVVVMMMLLLMVMMIMMMIVLLVLILIGMLMMLIMILTKNDADDVAGDDDVSMHRTADHTPQTLHMELLINFTNRICGRNEVQFQPDIFCPHSRAKSERTLKQITLLELMWSHSQGATAGSSLHYQQCSPAGHRAEHFTGMFS